MVPPDSSFKTPGIATSAIPFPGAAKVESADVNRFRNNCRPDAVGHATDGATAMGASNCAAANARTSPARQ
jgi:hypothetical protein